MQVVSLFQGYSYSLLSKKPDVFDSIPSTVLKILIYLLKNLMKKITFILLSILISPVIYAEHSIEHGEKKSAVCAGCHGEKGLAPAPLYPNLAGQNHAYLVKQLEAFQNGMRNDPIMSPIAKNLVEEDISDIAAYYASLENKKTDDKVKN